MSTATLHLESADEFAARLGVHRRTVVRMVGRGEIPGYRVGRLLKIDPEEALDALRTPAPVDEPNVAPPAEPRARTTTRRRTGRTLADYRAGGGR